MILAQIVAELVNEYPLLYTYGPLGVFSAFLMWKVDGRLGRIEHKLTGLNRTMLIELLSRESLDFKARRMAEHELEKNGGRGPEIP